MDLTSAVINLLKSPKGRELIESAEAAPIDQRTEWAEERDAARRQWETVGPALQAEEQAALRKLEEAKAEASKIVEQATRPYVAARERTEQARAKCNRIISRAEANLRASCSPRIRQWATQLENRRRILTVDERHAMINGQLTVTHSSAASMQKAVAKLNEILCRELKSLELQPLSEDELELKLNELQDSIPEVVVERITRRTGEMVRAGGCPDCR